MSINIEPFIIDYYNEYPQVMSVIDKMNEEVVYLKNENNKLKNEILEISKKYDKELKEYKQITELKMLLLELSKYEKNKKKKKFYCF